MEGCKCKPAKSYAERIIEHQEFVSLVKRMREAQDEFTVSNSRIAYKSNSNVKIETEEYAEHSALMYQKITLESEVDEYLKKMEA
jgi:hypothetical protein